MKKLITVISAIFAISSMPLFAQEVTVGYSNIYGSLNNSECTFSEMSHGFNVQGEYTLYKNIGVNGGFAMSFNADNTYYETESKTTTHTNSTNPNYVIFCGVSLIGDCDIVYFKTDLDITYSAIGDSYNGVGLSVGWSVNKSMNGLLLKAGFVSGFDVIKINPLKVELSKDYNLNGSMFYFVPCINIGYKF